MPWKAVLAATLVAAPLAAADPTIETIMSRDWVGTAPQEPRWTDDGRALVYELRRPGTEIVDLYRVDVASGKSTRLEDRDLGEVDPVDVVWSRDHKTKAFARNGDLFLRDSRGRLRQVTRTAEQESAPQLLLDGRLAYRRGGDFLAFDPATGAVSTLAELHLADDPDADQEQGFYERQQQRYFQVLREARERKQEGREIASARRAADPTRSPEPWYLGKGNTIQDAALSPDGSYLFIALGPERDKSEDDEQGADGGKADRMPVFVNDSGYVEVRDVRPKVGTGKPQSPRLALLDLRTHDRRDIALESLPGLNEDPLAELKASAAAELAAALPATNPPAAAAVEATAPAAGASATTSPRIVSLGAALWNESGNRIALQLFSYDNKDRWLAVVEPATGTLEPLERLHDPAWVNWRFNDFGWMNDGTTLWYLSEESGFSHLYLHPLDGGARALTSGPFEVDSPVLARDGRSFFVTANREQPGIVESYRIDARSGAWTRLTEHGGEVVPVVSPDEKQIAFLGSSVTRPNELFVQPLKTGAPAKKLTDTVSAAYRAVDWTEPEFVRVQSSHGAGEVWARVYTPADWSPERSYPAVAFVHGAGYLQNVVRGFSPYWHEFMFHTLLTRRGYVVIDMDYRGSSGYGRDWRTAIYRQMGWPEVEDYEDGLDWLVANRAVDRERIGVYGGSYGGFFTFMAMFTKPDLFAAGAALRPVSDWAHYNHGYTSNILNTPEVDPEAYRKSSPIEYAEGLQRPLLICHGMVDDNVVFQDTVRLVQRLIELGKTDYFETAIYPFEAHGFKQPSSWTDEYTRIWKLFERTLWTR